MQPDDNGAILVRHYTLRVLSLIAFVLTASISMAAEPLPDHIRADAPERYVVVPGDTLWDISARFLKEPWVWPEIWYINPQVRNPHLIYPGDVILLEWFLGRPRLQSGVRLSPRVRTSPLDNPVPIIPFDAIRHFLNGPRIVAEDALNHAPYVVAIADEYELGAEDFDVFVRGTQVGQHERWQIVRPAQDYTDPQTGDYLGREVIVVAAGKVTAGGDVSTIAVTGSSREIMVGDLLLPLPPPPDSSDFVPRAPDSAIDARVIDVFDGRKAGGQYHIVALNRGISDGLERGHVMILYRAGLRIPDEVEGGRVQLPDRRLGTALVFDVGNRFSYALVMEVTNVVQRGDPARSPVTAAR